MLCSHPVCPNLPVTLRPADSRISGAPSFRTLVTFLPFQPRRVQSASRLSFHSSVRRVVRTDRPPPPSHNGFEHVAAPDSGKPAPAIHPAKPSVAFQPDRIR